MIGYRVLYCRNPLETHSIAEPRTSHGSKFLLQTCSEDRSAPILSVKISKPTVTPTPSAELCNHQRRLRKNAKPACLPRQLYTSISKTAPNGPLMERHLSLWPLTDAALRLSAGILVFFLTAGTRTSSPVRGKNLCSARSSHVACEGDFLASSLALFLWTGKPTKLGQKDIKKHIQNKGCQNTQNNLFNGKA